LSQVSAAIDKELTGGNCLMAKFNFFIQAVIRPEIPAMQRYTLLELITDMHMSLPMNIRPVEAFEISVSEIEE
jgi:hypothetical protein